MTPLTSEWSSLRSIVPNVLQLSTIGYPFVSPGPVGGVGKAIAPSPESTIDDEMELYIRWWQLNTFLPMLHYYKPPSAFPMRKVTNYFQIKSLAT
jgi:alpha-glucosidase (family GH31 glycosyl hydrolase)